MEGKILVAIWEFVQLGALLTTIVTGVLAVVLFMLTLVTHTTEGREFNGGIGVRFASVSLLTLIVSGVIADPKLIPILLLLALLASRFSVKLVYGRWTVHDWSEG